MSGRYLGHRVETQNFASLRLFGGLKTRPCPFTHKRLICIRMVCYYLPKNVHKKLKVEFMKFRIFQTILLCITVSAVAVACGGSDTAPNGMTATDLLETSYNISLSLNTSQMYSTMTMSTHNDTITLTVISNEFSCIDNLNHKRYRSLNTSTNISSTLSSTTFDSEYYAFNNSLYLYRSSSANWIKTQSPVDSWDQERFANLFPLFTNPTPDAKYIGMETIGGIDCYKIEQNLTYDNVMKDLKHGGLSAFGNITQTDFKCTYWIAENTFYLIKASLDGNVVVVMDDFSIPINESTIVSYSGINQPLNITIPEAAINATEISYSDYVSIGTGASLWLPVP